MIYNVFYQILIDCLNMQKIITGTKYIKVVASETGDILHVPDKYLGHKLSGNVKTFFARKFSKEHYYTDEYGWRIGKKEKKNKKIDFFISGASFIIHKLPTS